MVVVIPDVVSALLCLALGYYLIRISRALQWRAGERYMYVAVALGCSPLVLDTVLMRPMPTWYRFVVAGAMLTWGVGWLALNKLRRLRSGPGAPPPAE